MYKLAQKHFKKTDTLLYRASVLHDIPDIRRSRDVFRDIVHAIVNQQLSGKAADTIFKRIEEKISKKSINPQNIVKLKHTELRSCGLSEAKARAIYALAKSVINGEIDLVNIHMLPDHDIVTRLTSIKGIGPWTVEMILMFSLGRMDIFSNRDLGLRKGIMYLYSLKRMPTEIEMEKMTKKWSPYRTYASRILWRVADARKK